MDSANKVFRVYMITNLVNGKRYIGKTYDVLKRFSSHVRRAKSEYNAGKILYYFQQAIVKYGEDNFCIGEIEVCDNEGHSLEREIYWIDFYKTNYRKYGKNAGYNGNDGGSAGNVVYQSDNMLEKISATNIAKAKPISRGMPIDPRLLEEDIREIKIYKHSKESRINNSIGAKIRAATEEGREHLSKLGKMNKGKPKSEVAMIRVGKTKIKKYLENDTPYSSAKLTGKEVIQIKTLYKSGTTNIQMYKLYPHIAKRTIRDIRNNVCWKHITI